MCYVSIDCKTHSINIKDGIRETIETPEFANNNIHIYGPCIAQGFYIDDSETISSYLQKAYNRSNNSVKIWNHGINGMGSLLNSCIQILSTPLYENDVVVDINTCFELTRNIIKSLGINVVDLSYLFKNKHYWFFNHPFHCNPEANILIAKELKKTIHIDNKNTTKRIVWELEKDHDISYITKNIHKYLNYLKENAFDNTDSAIISSIVMTADPFTNGHFELVKKALAESDYVYVFIVEEETGVYPFTDRYTIVEKSLKSFSNIKVLRTDSTFHSVYTFPEYNLRGNEYIEQIDSIPNLMIFGSIIAPTLNISKRYFGSEPYDTVTNQFNMLAKKALPNYGVDVVIMPRLEVSGNIVSGTKVRELANLGEFSKLAKLVPPATLNYLKKHYNYQNNLLISIIVNSKKVDVNLVRANISALLDSYEIVEYYDTNSIDYIDNIKEIINSCKGTYIAFIDEILFQTELIELKKIIESLSKKRSNITILRSNCAQVESSVVGKKLLEKIIDEKSNIINDSKEYFSFQNKIFEKSFLQNKCKCELTKYSILHYIKMRQKSLNMV